MNTQPINPVDKVAIMIMKKYSSVQLKVQLAMFLSFALTSWHTAGAQPMDIPNVFSAGSRAVAAEVNDNFNAVKNAVEDHDGRITALEDENADLKARLEAMELFIGGLETHMNVTTDSQGNPAIVISGANLHVNNGAGSTDSINGTGNVIIGYDEERTEGAAVLCSDGAYTDEMSCLAAGHLWAINHKSGSHNLVIGVRHNYSQYAGLVAGHSNTINGPHATVSSGSSNTARGTYASISGGLGNTASGLSSSISGGIGNFASGSYTSISGGNGNLASGFYSSVSGGANNSASGSNTSISGGSNNLASGFYSSVSGGNNNTAVGTSSSVSGGQSVTAPGQFDWAAGSLLE